MKYLISILVVLLVCVNAYGGSSYIDTNLMPSFAGTLYQGTTGWPAQWQGIKVGAITTNSDGKNKAIWSCGEHIKGGPYVIKSSTVVERDWRGRIRGAYEQRLPRSEWCDWLPLNMEYWE